MRLRISLLFALFATAQMALAEPPKWPEGTGRSLVQRNCLICHSAELIQGQRLSRETWLKEVEKMAGWGSPIPAQEREALVDYLFEHYSPDAPLPEPERERIKF